MIVSDKASGSFADVEMTMIAAPAGQAEHDFMAILYFAEAALATNYSRHMAPPPTAEHLLAGRLEADRIGRARRAGVPSSA